MRDKSRIDYVRVGTTIAAFAAAFICYACASSSLALLSWDQLGFPSWANLVAPHPAHTSLPDPRLLQGGLPISASSLLWSEDGSAIAVLGSNQQDPFLQLLDSKTGDVIEGHYSAEDSGHRNILSPGLEFPEIDRYGTPLATCPERALKATAGHLPDKAWQLTIWESETAIDSYRVYSDQWSTASLPPHLGNLAFSPDCQHLAFTLTGWIYYEGHGQQELWLLDLQAHALTRVLRGRWPLVRTWDYPVQNVAPSWSPDGNAVVFGDAHFGLEIFNVQTAERTWLSPPRASGYRPKWSSSGRWIAVHREWNTDTSVIVISSDSNSTDSVGSCYFPVDLAWSPTDDQLAFLCDDQASSAADLWLWSLADQR